MLDEGNEGVWMRMKEMASERGAVRVQVEWEGFEVFGVGTKGHRGDVLLVIWPVEAEEVRMLA